MHRLRRAYGAKIDWVVHEQGAELVACFDDVNRVIVYPEDELKHVNRRDFRKNYIKRLMILLLIYKEPCKVRWCVKVRVKVVVLRC